MKNTFKLLILLPLLLGASSPNDVQEGKINWVDFNTGFALAQNEGKIAIIDCYTEWCGWCKVMDKKTFTNQRVIDRINEKYVAIKFNPELPGKYNIGATDSVSGRQLLMGLSNNKPSGYPTFFYFVPQNKKMFQVAGYKDVKDLIEILDNVERYQKSLTKKTP
ncbi:MAG: hypothetical protein COA58_09300 [Bacteroidetes bacterium]|nr:MAG: hypothetical protein COA58_09300 [Bacteroidota bacterium]